MKIVPNYNGDYMWGLVPYLYECFKPLGDDNNNDVLLYGIQWMYDKAAREPYRHFKRRCLLAGWSPCEVIELPKYFHLDDFEFFTDVYSICPYTTRFMNDYFGCEKFKYIPFPFTNHSLKEYGNYDSTTCWVGGVHGQDHVLALDVISKFKYKFISSQQAVSYLQHPYEVGPNNKCTHVNVSNEEKMVQVSRCKSSLSFNKLYVKPGLPNNAFLTTRDKTITHRAFSHFEQGIMPQCKVRNNETASCKSLILCHRDPWNLIEDFYVPDEEFVYFDDFNQLEEILKDVESNFDKYKPIIENAFQRSHNYTVEKMFEYIKTNDPGLITWNANRAE